MMETVRVLYTQWCFLRYPTVSSRNCSHYRILVLHARFMPSNFSFLARRLAALCTSKLQGVSKIWLRFYSNCPGNLCSSCISIHWLPLLCCIEKQLWLKCTVTFSEKVHQNKNNGTGFHSRQNDIRACWEREQRNSCANTTYENEVYTWIKLLSGTN